MPAPDMHKTASDYWNLPQGQRAEGDPAPMIYPFAVPVPVGILPGLRLDLAEIVRGL